jgi:hypothetical protein
MEPVEQAFLHDDLAADQFHFGGGLVSDQDATEAVRDDQQAAAHLNWTTICQEMKTVCKMGGDLVKIVALIVWYIVILIWCCLIGHN